MKCRLELKSSLLLSIGLSSGLFFCAACSSSVDAQEIKPLTPNECVALALRRSPQAKAALYARQAQQVTVDREKPVSHPTITASASGTLQGPHVTFPRVTSDGIYDATVLPEQYGRVGLTIVQPLYRAGLGAARQRYAAQSESAVQDYRRALADVALMARKACIDLLRAKSGVRLAEDGLAAAVQYQKSVTQQIVAGLAKPVDAETVKGSVAEAQAGVEQANGGLRLARMALNHTLGLPLTQPIEVAAPILSTVVPNSPDVSVETALKNRPELRGLELNIKTARAGVSLARAQTQPTLGLRGQVLEQTPSAFQNQHYAAATLELKWSLFDGGRTRLDTAEASAQVKRLEALLEDTRSGIMLDVMQNLQKLRDIQGKIETAKIQRAGAEARLVVASAAYEIGRGTLVEMLAAAREVRTSKEREQQAGYDLAAAAADFEYAQGTLVSDADAIDVYRNGLLYRTAPKQSEHREKK